MTDKTAIAKLKAITIDSKKDFAEKLFLVRKNQGHSAEDAALMTGETLRRLNCLDRTKLCATGT